MPSDSRPIRHSRNGEIRLIGKAHRSRVKTSSPSDSRIKSICFRSPLTSRSFGRRCSSAPDLLRAEGIASASTGKRKLNAPAALVLRPARTESRALDRVHRSVAYRLARRMHESYPEQQPRQNAAKQLWLEPPHVRSRSAHQHATPRPRRRRNRSSSGVLEPYAAYVHQASCLLRILLAPKPRDQCPEVQESACMYAGA